MNRRLGFVCVLVCVVGLSPATAFESSDDALSFVKQSEFTLYPQDTLMAIIDRYDREAAGRSLYDALAILDYGTLLEQTFDYHHASIDWLKFESISWGADVKYLSRDYVGMLAIQGMMLSYRDYFGGYFDDFNLFLTIMNPAPLFLFAWTLEQVGMGDFVDDAMSCGIARVVMGDDMEGWTDEFYYNTLALGVADKVDPFRILENPQPSDYREIEFYDVLQYDFLRMRYLSLGLGYSYTALIEPLVEAFVDYDDGFDTKLYGKDINSIFQSFYVDVNMLRIMQDLLDSDLIRGMTRRFNSGLFAFAERAYRLVDQRALGVKLFSLPLFNGTLLLDGKAQSNRFIAAGEETVLQGRATINVAPLSISADLTSTSTPSALPSYDYATYLSLEIGGLSAARFEASAILNDSTDIVPDTLDGLQIGLTFTFET